MDDNNEVGETEEGTKIQPTIYYCYDALCGWCYGFSPVIKKLSEEYKEKIIFDVLSGGMVMPDNAQPISTMAKFISEGYKNIEQLSGIKFGDDYLWHIFNPNESDWFLNSEKPAIALSILKEKHPEELFKLLPSFNMHTCMKEGI